LTKSNPILIIAYRFPMIYDRNIIGKDAFDQTDCTAANRPRRTARQPLQTSKTTLLSELLCVKLAFFTSENKKTAQPYIGFNGDRNCLWRPGRNALLLSNPELNCPIAITNTNFQMYYRLFCPHLSRIIIEIYNNYHLFFSYLFLVTNDSYGKKNK